MLLQESRERPFELTGSVPVNDTDRALVGQQRIVEKTLRSRERFVYAAPDHIEIYRRRLARLKIDADVHLCGSGWADDLKIVQVCAHPLSAYIEIGGIVVNRGHHG